MVLLLNMNNNFDESFNKTRKAGALGTKIIGSGGGGCMVAIVSEKSKETFL